MSECRTKSRNERFSNPTHKLRIHFPLVFRLQRTADHSADAVFEEYRLGNSQMMKGVAGRLWYLIRPSDFSLCWFLQALCVIWGWFEERTSHGHCLPCKRGLVGFVGAYFRTR